MVCPCLYGPYIVMSCVCGKSASSNLQSESMGLFHSWFCSWRFCVLGPGSLGASVLRKL